MATPNFEMRRPSVTDAIMSRLQRSKAWWAFNLGRWPRLLHFAPLALKSDKQER
jgi:hypothetical protein